MAMAIAPKLLSSRRLTTADTPWISPTRWANASGDSALAGIAMMPASATAARNSNICRLIEPIATLCTHSFYLRRLRDLNIPVLRRTAEVLAQLRQTRVRNVAQAVNLARHLAHGWNDPALPDDDAAIADLL